MININDSSHNNDHPTFTMETFIFKYLNGSHMYISLFYNFLIVRDKYSIQISHKFLNGNHEVRWSTYFQSYGMNYDEVMNLTAFLWNCVVTTIQRDVIEGDLLVWTQI